VNSERLAWVVISLKEVLEASLLVGTFLLLLIAVTIVYLQRRPSLSAENVTLRRHDAAQPQGVTETVRQSVASSPTLQPLGRLGGGSWSTQVLNYLQSHPGLIGCSNGSVDAPAASAGQAGSSLANRRLLVPAPAAPAELLQPAAARHPLRATDDRAAA
jgi:hypothetical protein